MFIISILYYRRLPHDFGSPAESYFFDHPFVNVEAAYNVDRWVDGNGVKVVTLDPLNLTCYQMKKLKYR